MLVLLITLTGCYDAANDEGEVPDPSSEDSETSGLDPALPLNELSYEDLWTLCRWGDAIASTEPGEVTDCGRFSVTDATVGECVDGMDGLSRCTLTVETLERCWRLQVDDPCRAFEEPSCLPPEGCVGPG